MIDLSGVVAELRAGGGDTAGVEAKLGRGGLPESLTKTLCALANHPGGGTVLLGLDERDDFRVHRLPDREKLRKALGGKARSYEPPVRLTMLDAVVDGIPVVAATVHECDPSQKPCRLASSGAAYVRSHDGDYQMSDLERQGFLAARTAPHFDRRPVEGSSRADLDPDLAEIWRRSVRARSTAGLGRFDGEELLKRAGVLLDDGCLSVAGLLALGTHPQTFFPRFVITAAAEPGPGDPAGARARDLATFDGPLVTMLDDAVDWASRALGTAVVAGDDGRVRDVPIFPRIAIREIVSNALVHRDLAPWSESMAIEIRVRRDRIVVTNPGGLYGVTVDRLGKEKVTSARNARLLALCQDVRSSSGGERVVEAIASGLQTVAAELDAAGLPPARFSDYGIRFTVVLLRQRVVARRPAADSAAGRLLDAFDQEPVDVPELERRTGMQAPNIRKLLRELRDRWGLVEQIGGRGRSTVYRLR